MALVGASWVFSHLPGAVPVLLESERHQPTVIAAACVTHRTVVTERNLVALFKGFAADV